VEYVILLCFFNQLILPVASEHIKIMKHYDFTRLFLNKYHTYLHYQAKKKQWRIKWNYIHERKMPSSYPRIIAL